MTNAFLNVLELSISASWLILALSALSLIFRSFPKGLSYALWIPVGIRLALPLSLKSALSLLPQKAYAVQSSVGERLSYTDGKRALRKAKIYLCDAVSSPFIFGILRPKICLPRDLSENEAALVLRHEEIHLLRRDHLLKAAAFLLLAVHWFNPLVWLAYRLFERDMELSCDERVIADLGDEAKAEYSRTLLRFGTRNNFLSCPTAFAESDVKRRIKNVLSYRKRGLGLLLPCILLSLALCAGFMTVPAEEAAETENSGGESEANAVIINADSITAEEEQPMPAQEPLYFYRPLEGEISESFYPLTSSVKVHPAIDIRAEKGAPVYAAADGVVTDLKKYTESLNGGVLPEDFDEYSLGNCVVLLHDYQYASIYGCLSELAVSEGDDVKAGELIGRVGASGKATGPHLHFELRLEGRPVDPSEIFEE